MRFSFQRDTIEKTIRSAKCHPTADWIYSKVKKIIPNISLGTVYRNLNHLSANGKIKTIQDGSLTRYDGNKNPHHHLKCNQCSEIVDIDILDFDIENIIKRKFDFDPSDVEITITGKCNKHKQK